MRHSTLASILAFTFVLSSCGDEGLSFLKKSPIDEVHTVEWFADDANAMVYEEIKALCRNNPGLYKDKPNCINVEAVNLFILKSPIDDVHTVEWFADKANVAVYEEIKALCRSNPGLYRNKPNCINVEAVGHQDDIKRAHVSEGMSLAAGIKSAVLEFGASNGYWPKDNAEAGVAQPSAIQGNSVLSVTVSGGGAGTTLADKGVIEILFDQKVNFGAVLVLETTGNAEETGTIRWICKAKDDKLKTRWLPARCNVETAQHSNEIESASINEIKRAHINTGLSLADAAKSTVTELATANGDWPKDNAEVAGTAQPSWICNTTLGKPDAKCSPARCRQ